MTENKETKHPGHKAALSKLNRVGGQIDGVKRMIGDNRYCPDILIQLRAIRAALKRVETDILEAHLKSCVTDAIASVDEAETAQKIAEIKDLFKRFEE